MKDKKLRSAEWVGRLAPLGIERLYAGGENYFGHGFRPKAFFWGDWRAQVSAGTHVDFAAPDRAAVRAFYGAALAAGGRDNGAPGLRPQYRANHYGTVVLDPDGHHIEAACYVAK